MPGYEVNNKEGYFTEMLKAFDWIVKLLPYNHWNVQMLLHIFQQQKNSWKFLGKATAD